MYDWLDGALRDSAEVVTASRRLAKVLREAHGEQQIAAGRLAWESPRIRSLSGWLSELLTLGAGNAELPVRITPSQSRLLWEQCLRGQLDDALPNVSLLARQAQESWQRLQDFTVPLAECAAAAQGRDQHVFARAATNYHSQLRERGWVDEAMVPALVTRLVSAGALALPRRISFAGFDRLVPQMARLEQALAEAGVEVGRVAMPVGAADAKLRHFDNVDAELRAAGRWARQTLDADAGCRIGIVVTNLERDAQRAARLVREGAVPGWQLGGGVHAAGVDISYGRRLSQYPMCALALRLLGWLHLDLSSRDLGLLLNAPWSGDASAAAYSRVDLHLRRIPGRRWSPECLLRELGRLETGDDGALAASVGSLQELRRRLPRRDSPAAWARIFQDVLESFRWPGEVSLDSNEFQLLNRWRELLNELSSLELVGPAMTVGEAHTWLSHLATDTIFQPEGGRTAVSVLGPLEAAGLCFDRLWVTGLTASAWPPASRPLALVSRTLQRKYRMPDADPQDTLDYARRVLSRLRGSARDCICSYALTEGDAEQTAAGLAGDAESADDGTRGDPGWFAAAIMDTAQAEVAGADPVPAVTAGEEIRGGAAALQWQIEDPFVAFVQARLGAQPLPAIVPGLAPTFRGTFIHDVLYRLYRDLPTRDELRAWSAAEADERIRAALQGAARRHGRNADAVLQCLLSLEAQRLHDLVRRIVQIDSQRKYFKISELEAKFNVNIEGIALRIRVDRIDRDRDGAAVILDYKSGAAKKLMDRSGALQDVQLAVYARAVNGDISDLALLNVDSRSVALSGAGRTLTPELNWDALLAEWQGQVAEAARDMCRGDVRMSRPFDRRAGRPLAILSRLAEVRDEF